MHYKRQLRKEQDNENHLTTIYIHSNCQRPRLIEACKDIKTEEKTI